MMKLAAVHHGYPVGTEASGYVATGGQVRFLWDGANWQPQSGYNRIAQAMGPITDHGLRTRVNPDISTLLALGGHWGDHHAAKESAYYAA